MADSVLQGAEKHAIATPQDNKDCQLSILQIGLDGEKVAELGKAVLDLADLSCRDSTLMIPVDCNANIKMAVGQPQLIVRCR